MESNTQTRQTIIRLLSSMASAKEISQYVKRFSQLDAKRFAVVKVGGAVLRDDLEALTSSLTFLQEVGLTPIVVHGAGPQLDQEMNAAGITKETVNGLRVTTPEVLAIVRKVFLQQNLALVEALQQAGARSRRRTSSWSRRCRPATRARPRSCPACSRPTISTATPMAWSGK